MNIKKIFIPVIILLVISCGKFDDLNVDPNNPVKVETGTLITSSQRFVSNAVGSTLGALYAQHISDITYTEGGRYQSIQDNFDAWYTGPLQNLQTVIDLNTDPDTRGDVLGSGSNANQIAVARIMKAYFFQFLSDRWGAIPYSEALRANEGIFTPKYDSQESIYNDLFEELKQAVDQMDGGASVKGDIIFGGDMESWKLFANTLRMNMAIRISDVSETKARAEFLDAMSDGFITDDVFYTYLGEANNENPWFTSFRTRTDFAISENLEDYMSGLNDPRLPQFADPTLNSVAAGNPIIVGMPYGRQNPTNSPPDVSYPSSTNVKCQDCPLAIMTMAQVHFAMAEAAARGWIGTSAENHYKDAIRASWDQWDVTYTQAALDAYTGQAGVVWNAANWRMLIGNQKWIALYMQGYEMWAEWRRLDYPVLVMAEEPLNPSGAIPLRNIYGTLEQNLNGANYQAAVSQFLGGNDNDGVRLWWDVQ